MEKGELCMEYKLDLTGKIAIVTGASRGIGKSTAIGLASLGTHVILMSRNKQRLEETMDEIHNIGGKADIYTVDLLDLEQIENTISQLKENYKNIDILVNNAGVTCRKPSTDITEEDWDRVQNTNLKSYFFLTSAIGREFMIPQRKGKIVSMASMGGILGITKSAPYCSSKGGVIQMTKVLACEWAPYNIQVNAVCPAYIKTDLISKAIEDKEFYQSIVNRTPAGRLGIPEEVVGPILFLASDMANYITGHALLVDGGMTALAV